MGLISKLLTVVGLLATVTGNLMTFYGVRTAVNGMMDSGARGIGDVASGMSTAHSYSLIGLVGCFILVVGLALSAFSSKAKRGLPSPASAP